VRALDAGLSVLLVQEVAMNVKVWAARCLALGAALGLGMAMPAASATAPGGGTFDTTDSFTDTEVCADFGFDVFVPGEHEYGFFKVFTNRDGDVVKVQVHTNYDATITANGKTIYERDTWTDFFYPDGSRMAGNSVHIQGVGGMVQHDAGQVVFDGDGNVVAIHGPHPQFEGETFCPALLP
jgi:hypothetical protein